jgi:hypothetical protein
VYLGVILLKGMKDVQICCLVIGVVRSKHKKRDKLNINVQKLYLCSNSQIPMMMIKGVGIGETSIGSNSIVINLMITISFC